MIYVFSGSIVDFEQVKSRPGTKSHRDMALLLFVKKHLFMVVRGELK